MQHRIFSIVEEISSVDPRVRSASLRNLVGNDGKAASLFASTGSFDRGIERQQVGLVGNLANHVGNRGDLLRLLAKFVDRARRGVDYFGDRLHRVGRTAHDLPASHRRLACLFRSGVDRVRTARNALNRRRQLLDRGRDRLRRLAAGR